MRLRTTCLVQRPEGGLDLLLGVEHLGEAVGQLGHHRVAGLAFGGDALDLVGDRLGLDHAVEAGRGHGLEHLVE